MAHSKYDKPELPIGPVLEYYGADTSRAHGRGWTKIVCPFHEDRSPSATVNLTTNKFFCWSGCTDKPEDAVGIIQHVDGTTFLAALEKAQGITGQSGKPVRGMRGSRRGLFAESWADA